MMTRSAPLLLATLILGAALRADGQERTDRFGIGAAEAAAVIGNMERERQLRIPMRDGVRLNADILFPPENRENLPAILIRTPYGLDGEIGSWVGPLSEWLQDGYAVVVSHERGRHWSEGEYHVLNGAFEDGYDTVEWITQQPWSNGKVGSIGCSSSAENQLGLAATAHPGHAAMIAMSPNAGIGAIGPHREQGNWFRGGVNQMWINWYYPGGYAIRPEFPPDLTRDVRILLERYYDIVPNIPERNLARAAWHLPIQDMMRALDALPSDFDEFIKRTPADPAWDEMALADEGDRFGNPAIWVLSWYDYATAPDIAFYNWQRKNAASASARDNQFLIIGPTTHCGQGFESEHTVVGERDLGDARFDYFTIFDSWLAHWLKGERNAVLERPKVALFTIGKGWQGYETFPPPGAEPTAWHFTSEAGANSLAGDGRLDRRVPRDAGADSFVYDPMRPVPSVGGGGCCYGDDLDGGSYDQSGVQLRNDVLVYTSEPFEEPTEVTGFIDTVLFVSSDAKDTDFAVKLTQVLPDGRAFNLADTIMRARYRNGYETETFMRAGEVYELRLPPMATSVLFEKGHRIRVEITSSNFPHYLRNLNTGGNNYDEKEGVRAKNTVHFSTDYPSRIMLPVVRR